MSMAWVAIGTTLVGAGASVYGTQQNKKAAKSAQEANARAQAETNALNLRMWLESRGVGENGKPINAKMPRWMTWRPSAGNTLTK
jgi:hypothetical protein